MKGVDTSLFEDPTLLLEFIAESLEHLDSIESKILEYERSPDDKDLINSIFRAIHSIKGAASFFNLSGISELSHKLETILNELRNDKRMMNPELCDILLSGADMLKTLINQLSESTDSQIQSETIDVTKMLDRIESVLSSPVKSPEEKTADENIPFGGTTETTPLVNNSKETIATLTNTDPVKSSNDIDDNANLPSDTSEKSETQQKFKSETKNKTGSAYEITPQIISSFKIEAMENLDHAEEAIMTLDKTRDEHSQVDGLFRAIHTIKGASDYLGLSPIKTLAHELENLLDMFRKKTEYAITDNEIDVMFESIDILKLMCESPQDSGTIETSYIRQRIKEESINFESPDTVKIENRITGDSVKQDETLAVFISSSRQYLLSMRNCLRRIEEGSNDKKTIGTYLRSAKSLRNSADYMKFGSIVEDIQNQMNIADGMQNAPPEKVNDSVTILYESINSIERSLDSLSGTSGTETSSENDAQNSSSDGETTPANEPAGIEPIKPYKTSGGDDNPAVSSGKNIDDTLNKIRECYQSVLNGAREPEVIESFLITVRELKTLATDSGYGVIAESATRQEDVLDIVHSGRIGLEKEFIEILGESVEEISKELEFHKEKAQEEKPVCNSKDCDAIKEEPSIDTARDNSESEALETRTLSSAKKEQAPELDSKINVAQAVKTDDSATASQNSSSAKTKVQSVKTMRIEEEKLDAFMSLVGELIISKNTFSHIAKRLGSHDFDESTIEEFNAAMFSVNRITDELQNNVMSMRMVPVKTVFQRFPRLVRDLAKKKNKLVELYIQGEETEFDKSIAEDIGDPLVHLVRNAVDHGLDTPEERRKAGKSETGTIILRAAHEGNNMIIEVIDDGRGIDEIKVLKKAIEKGIVTAEDAQNMSREKIQNLIFLPGFSTADQVTDVSGRGVGMDVVHNNIAKLKGTVKLESEPGQGTKVRVELPLTLAIIEALLVNTGGKDFALPLDSVLETIQVKHADISTMQKKEVVLLRGEPIGICRLTEVMGIPETQTQDVNRKIPIVIIAAGTRKVGIVVDQLMDQEEIVIKPLHESLAELPGLGGASIMGDGRIVLILDPLDLLNIAENKAIAII